MAESAEATHGEARDAHHEESGLKKYLWSTDH